VAAEVATAGAEAGAAAADEEITFRLTSDWGAAFPDQEVDFTFLLRNERPDGEGNSLNDVRISSTLPSNLEVLGATADRGQDPSITGNDILYTLDELQPGESVEITVNTLIKGGIPAGTILVVQGQLLYDTITIPLNSNIVTVRIVGTGSRLAATITTAGPSPTPAPSDTATPAPSDTATPDVAGATGATATTPSPTQAVAGVAEEPGETEAAPTGEPAAPIPATSAGVPVAGFFLLGMTMLVRTVRLKRERERL
jgi:hypothetical protein